jgi:hypothetical protein
MTFAIIDGVFGAVFRSDGVEEFIAQDDFNLDKLDGTGASGFDIASDKLDLYTYRGGWYGVLPLAYGVFATGFGYVTCHVIDKSNTTDTPHLSNPTLPMFVEATRTAGTGADLVIKTASWRGGISGKKPEGSRADRAQVETIIEKSVAGGGVIVPVITLRNNTTFQGKVNHVRIRYATVSLFTDGNKPVIIGVYKNGTLVNESFVAKNTATSVTDVDVSATAYTPSSEPVGGVVLGRVDTARINLFKGDVIIAAYPGETITFTASSSNATELTLFLRWLEEF